MIHSSVSIDGSFNYPFIADEVYEKLVLANKCLMALFPNMELVILDAYRTPAMQKYLLDFYFKKSVYSRPDISLNCFRKLTGEFLSDNPSENYNPYSAGGAVDVSILYNSTFIIMPTRYGEFKFHSNIQQEKESKENEDILLKIMTSVGFVNDNINWWHYQYGTLFWANIKKTDPILIENFSPPIIQDDATHSLVVPKIQPFWQGGVAQIFTNPLLRQRSLAGIEHGYYYVRSSHPSLEGLKNFIRRDFICTDVHLVESGLSACIIAVRALLQKNGTLLYDKHIYYETERAILKLSKMYSWTLLREDILNLDVEKLKNNNIKIDLVFIDNPRNWFLDTFDIGALSKICYNLKSYLIVDTSVQPLQDILSIGVDIIVMSLSKYPSNGMTVGGAILSKDIDISNKVGVICSDEGHVLSPCAAITIWEQIISIRDRLTNVSKKAKIISDFLLTKEFIKKVRFPNSLFLNGYAGGQVSFHLNKRMQGYIIEKIIGQNSLSNSSCLHLACTFGASFTTIEHFSSNKRKRIGIPVKDTNENFLPDDIVRIGVGNEPVIKILEQLNFVLNTSFQVCKLLSASYIYNFNSYGNFQKYSQAAVVIQGFFRKNKKYLKTPTTLSSKNDLPNEDKCASNFIKCKL